MGRPRLPPRRRRQHPERGGPEPVGAHVQPRLHHGHRRLVPSDPRDPGPRDRGSREPGGRPRHRGGQPSRSGHRRGADRRGDGGVGPCASRLRDPRASRHPGRLHPGGGRHRHRRRGEPGLGVGGRQGRRRGCRGRARPGRRDLAPDPGGHCRSRGSFGGPGRHHRRARPVPVPDRRPGRAGAVEPRRAHRGGARGGGDPRGRDGDDRRPCSRRWASR